MGYGLAVQVAGLRCAAAVGGAKDRGGDSKGLLPRIANRYCRPIAAFQLVFAMVTDVLPSVHQLRVSVA